ncbi:hypothetical protein CANARDRAFT_29635 [[Candida] arabinofermentans NRRL YB-2248]|uniref:Potassium channel domain-containing protein n=1 Tax=[Candida] arabinofermentans NRRL YB-2248 TaxID=983967 RepID=A0A1E4SWM5_9ASCO|nr:hypothetical protein CANARDRAFT_29635 [[Candida] arabinofermentans NRRL YB-2248]
MASRSNQLESEVDPSETVVVPIATAVEEHPQLRMRSRSDSKIRFASPTRDCFNSNVPKVSTGSKKQHKAKPSQKNTDSSSKAATITSLKSQPIPLPKSRREPQILSTGDNGSSKVPYNLESRLSENRLDPTYEEELEESLLIETEIKPALSLDDELSLQRLNKVSRTSTKLHSYYDNLLNSTDWNVSNLSVQPGDPHFVWWFAISSYFPLICGCLGPLANMLSIAAVVCRWKEEKGSGDTENDEAWCYAVNSISMFCGIISNISLLLNFRKKLRYNISQVISLSGWLIATILLLGLLVAYHIEFMKHEKYLKYEYSFGFWFAVFTVILNFSTFVLLCMNELGFLLKKYPPVFNIDAVQKTLMTQSIFFVAWCLGGAGMFTALLNINFGNALYFAEVTILTIGLGDYVPSSQTAQSLTLIWCIVGLVMFGLIISTITELVLYSSSSTFYWHRVQFYRNEILNGLIKKEKTIDSRESFDLMKEANRKAAWREKLAGFASIFVTWLIFWLLGAMVFTLFEGWSYHLSCYFSFLCFVTIGYGVPAPATAGGKSFFCLWAIAAIPIMTIFVSSLSGILFASLGDFQNFRVIDDLELILRKINFCGSLDLVIKMISKGAEELNTLDKETMDEINQDALGSLLQVLAKSSKLNSLEFINTDEFSQITEIANELINYSNEGLSLDELTSFEEDREEHFVKIMKRLDPAFDETKFRRKFTPTSTRAASTMRRRSESLYRMNTQSISKSVLPEEDSEERYNGDSAEDVNEGGLIDDTDSNSYASSSEDNAATADNDDKYIPVVTTRFKKKKDFILTRLSELELMFIELKKSTLLSTLKPDYKHTYAEWLKFYKLTGMDTHKHDPLFWLGENSPFGYPNLEPMYFTFHYLHFFELKLHQLALDYDSLDMDAIVLE